MVLCFLFPYFFPDPLPSFNWLGGEELKWRQLVHHQLMSQQGSHYSPHSKLKQIIKALISGKSVTSGVSDVEIASIHSENPSEGEDYEYEN